MKKLLFCFFLVSCQASNNQEATNYNYSDYQEGLLEYQRAYDSQVIEITGNQARGYRVKGYVTNQLIYDKWSDMATDTTAMIQEADQAINQLIPSPNENH